MSCRLFSALPASRQHRNSNGAQYLSCHIRRHTVRTTRHSSIDDYLAGARYGLASSAHSTAPPLPAPPAGASVKECTSTSHLISKSAHYQTTATTTALSTAMDASPTPARQLQPHMDERLSHPPASSQPPANTASSSVSSFQLLSLLPPPLLALVASHIDVRCLLRLQRCSSVQHRLRADESCMAVAWCWAELSVSMRARLHRWTLPYAQCIAGTVSPSKHCILVSMWRAALPAFRVVVARTTENQWRQESCEVLEALIRRDQPTRWITAKRDAYDAERELEGRGRWECRPAGRAASGGAEGRRLVASA